MFSLKHPSKLLLGPTSMPAPAPTPPRAIPYGCLGYTNIQRRNATINQPNHPTVRSNADLLVPSKSSVQRWNRRVAARGNPDRLGAKGFRGKFKLSRRGAFTIWWYKHTRPGALFVEVRRFLAIATGESLTPSQCSRELKRLGFTRKKLQRQSKNRCEASRVRWWTNDPNRPQIEDRGVAGLDTRLLGDIDEKGIWLHEANRAYGGLLRKGWLRSAWPQVPAVPVNASPSTVSACATIAPLTPSRHSPPLAGRGRARGNVRI
jgi:hypothetical protein